MVAPLRSRRGRRRPCVHNRPASVRRGTHPAGRLGLVDSGWSTRAGRLGLVDSGRSDDRVGGLLVFFSGFMLSPWSYRSLLASIVTDRTSIVAPQMYRRGPGALIGHPSPTEEAQIGIRLVEHIVSTRAPDGVWLAGHSRGGSVSVTSRQSGGVGFRPELRWLLGGALIPAGVGHLTTQRTEFRAQVPDWFPIDDDVVVIASGIVEIALGASLIGLPRHRVIVGTIVAAFFVAVFFVAVFSGNIAQWTEGTDAFGLDTDSKRFARLFFQPVLVIWALGATGAWKAFRAGTWPATPARNNR